MDSERNLSNAVGGKTARACDNCVKKRAKWYCAADDGFLCQLCDASVHSANPMARRHQRVRLKIPSINSDRNHWIHDKFLESHLGISVPSWHHGFKTKARTSKHKKNFLHLVPEILCKETSREENVDQLLYRVPTIDPFAEKLSTSSKSMSNGGLGNEMNYDLHGWFLESELDPEEFAADVEGLLGKQLEDEWFDMDRKGLLSYENIGKVKVEDGDGEVLMAHQLNTTQETLINGDRKAKIEETMTNNYEDFNKGIFVKNEILLRLDYESVILAWNEHRSPWTTGERPQLQSNDCWHHHCMGTCGTMRSQSYGIIGMMTANGSMVDPGREARVSRYREKRRTRLFSKKIRYEVRKLNAEKRPRMKGRFVKRANSVAPLSFP